MQVHRRLLDTQPGYAEARRRIEEHAFRHSRSMATGRPGCTRIPVVVHVVHKTAAQNISQAQIDSQIQVLNQDFRKQNSDVVTVPGPFAPLVGDARLQFELASEDPEGNVTDGITRTETNQDGFDSDDAVKFAATGGADAWPADRYLNIWVCQLVGGLLGYAQFPGGPANTDGVVITHTGFGTTGTAAAPFDLGRTATHEIGHWLNLRHIWGDDGDGCGGSDFVADTPNQGGSNVGKPSFPSISCSNGPNGDMFMNFMDYVDDDTMVMFSEGQVSRMQAALDGPRSMIGSSVTCTGAVPPGPGKALPKEPSKELPKEGPKEFPKDPPKEIPKDPPKELPKDGPKEFPKDPPKEFPKELQKEFPKESPKDLQKDPPKEFPKDGPKEFQKEFPKENPKDFQKEFPKDGPKDFQKEFTKESPKDFQKEFPKDGPFDTQPKSFLELPVGLPQPPVMQPMQPMQPFQPVNPMHVPGQVGMATPFVLATGTDSQASTHESRDRAAAAYLQLLSHYTQLYQRGMLDTQGHAAWQQAWQAYQQLIA